MLCREELPLILRRFNTILYPFITQFNWEFYRTLQHMKAIIVGSCALDMMLGTRNTPPRDLNIVVPHGSLTLMETFIQNVLSYHSIAAVCHPSLSLVVHDFRKYGRHRKIITVSKPKHLMHPLHVVLNSPSTSDMTFITAGGGVSFFSDLTREYHTLKTMSGEGVLTGQKLGSIGKERFDVHVDTSFLNGPCHHLCPALWRHLSNRKEYVTVDWDQRFSVKSILYDNDIEWCLNDYCFNRKCLYNVDVMINNCDIPPRIMPYSLESVRQQSKFIKNHEPMYERMFKGLLYATACTEPLIVDVPLQDGVDQLGTLDELEVNYWVRQRDVMVCSASRKQHRRTFDTFPNSSTQPDDIYTVFLEQNNDYVAPNALLEDIAPNIEPERGLEGNILVIKQR
ncbi:uncharacterized protein EDB91DRAFT_1244967 [Suillus paluster]|uniref:uncharacterized protein n=1 Tax=Suillus paluster TaxID=48578 RepID=UPI001B877ED4|nr:uncharacterized protein EDB91DRAFT_1244967 [Suillus paluster]KAG1748250.1 hypothetical protein EDB91DRAFT_1244967 [Suillus paluster]